MVDSQHIVGAITLNSLNFISNFYLFLHHTFVMYCWNSFLGPRWSGPCLGCLISKLELRSLLGPYKCSIWPDAQYIPSANPQTASQLWVAHPKQVLWPQPIRYFYFFILQPINILAFYPILQFSKRRLCTLWSISFTTPKLFSWIFLTVLDWFSCKFVEMKFFGH